MVLENTMKLDMNAKSDVNISHERVVSLVSSVLRSRFPGDAERQYIDGKGVRLNFCCPYCGDSYDPRKKRGNMYVNWLYFKCYNGGCEKYTDFTWFLKDFGHYDDLTDDEKVAAKLSIDESKKTARLTQMRSYEMNLSAMSGTDFSKALIPRVDLMKAAKLWNIYPDSPTGVYLTKRQQTIDNRFAWDNYKKRLFIFNLDKTGEWVFGMQTRQFGEAEKTGSKYKTYHVEDIWFKFMKRTDPAFLESMSKINHLSTLFGLLHINFGGMITLFEGPLDHFLFPNSVATCSINNPWPFDLDNKRWFQDNDDAGRKKALEYLEAGDSVFMWKKFLSDYEVPSHKVKDLNDLRVIEWAKNVKFDFEGYFTEHKLDAINI